MTRILSGRGKAPSKTEGRPGYTQLLNPSSSPRGRIGSARRSIRRLFARDPASANANIGTSKDVIFSANQAADLAGPQNPAVIGENSGSKGSTRSINTADTRKHIVNRSTNRTLKKR